MDGIYPETNLLDPQSALCKEVPSPSISAANTKIAGVSCWREDGQENLPPDQYWEEGGDRIMTIINANGTSTVGPVLTGPLLRSSPAHKIQIELNLAIVV